MERSGESGRLGRAVDHPRTSAGALGQRGYGLDYKWRDTGGSFTIAATGGTNHILVDANIVSGSATLVYQVDRTNGIITISPVNLATQAGLNTVQTNLTPGTPVKVFGVPQTDGSIKAYVFFYFTGTMPTS